MQSAGCRGLVALSLASVVAEVLSTLAKTRRTEYSKKEAVEAGSRCAVKSRARRTLIWSLGTLV